MLARLALTSWLLSLAGIAGAGQVLPLGPGTACTLMSQPEARKTLGVHQKHVLACASPDGTLVHVQITRAGRVACTERLQIAADGRMTLLGASCGGRPTSTGTSKARDIGEPINLSGNWLVDAALVSCTFTVVQDGDTLALSGDCGTYGALSGSGTISFTGRKFTSDGSASGGIVAEFCPGATVHMEGEVSPDGQTVDGTVACGVYELSFGARRLD